MDNLIQMFDASKIITSDEECEYLLEAFHCTVPTVEIISKARVRYERMLRCVYFEGDNLLEIEQHITRFLQLNISANITEMFNLMKIIDTKILNELDKTLGR